MQIERDKSKRDKRIVLTDLSGFVGVWCDSCDCSVESFKTAISEIIVAFLKTINTA